jgi:hypothetical protein
MRRLGHGLHKGQQNRLRPHIQHPLDHHRIVPGRAHGGAGRAIPRRLQQRLQPSDIHRRMFGIKQNPVEFRLGKRLGHHWAA